MNNSCKEDGCRRTVHAMGLCHKHYLRWIKHGDPKIVKDRKGRIIPDPAGFEGETPEPPKRKYDSDWEAFCYFIGAEKKRVADPPRPPKGALVRHGIISDLHVPFHDETAVLQAIEWLISEGVDELWIGGDFLDCYSLSRFHQYKAVPVQEEIIEARKILDYCSRSFSRVHVLEGNHESRERKYYANKLPPDLVNHILRKSMVAWVTEDMKNVVRETRVCQGTDMNWIAQIGSDAVIGHAETMSKIPLRPAGNFKHWLDEWHQVLGMARPRLVIEGHTHQSGMTWIGPTLVVESGCLCKIQGYALEPRLYGKPQRQGCLAFSQIKGITDMRSIKLFWPEERTDGNTDKR